MDERTKLIDWAARNHETKWAALQWIYDAAVAVERKQMAVELRAKIDLDGFGCACTQKEPLPPHVFDTEDPRCADGEPACGDCLQRGACLNEA